MTTQTEALRMALEALGNCEYGDYDKQEMLRAIAACKEALAAPQTTGNIVMDSYNQMVAMKEAAPHGDREPNNDEVICPNCTTQFRAIPVNVQKLMLDAGFEPPFTAAPQSEPVAIRHSFDGYGWMYIDNGHGSGWRGGIDKEDAEFLFTHPSPAPQGVDIDDLVKEFETKPEYSEAIQRGREWVKAQMERNAAPHGEPVALIDGNGENVYFPSDAMYHYWIGRNCTPLYTHPAPAPHTPNYSTEAEIAAWKAGYKHGAWSNTQAPAPLTDEQIESIAKEHEVTEFGGMHMVEFARAIERHVKGEK